MNAVKSKRVRLKMVKIKNWCSLRIKKKVKQMKNSFRSKNKKVKKILCCPALNSSKTWNKLSLVIYSSKLILDFLCCTLIHIKIFRSLLSLICAQFIKVYHMDQHISVIMTPLMITIHSKELEFLMKENYTWHHSLVKMEMAQDFNSLQ